MTITLNNVDSQFLQVLKSLVALKPNVTIVQDEGKDTIKENILKDIELYRQGKLKTYPHGTEWKYLRR
ncbi:MAG: hypothetical protein CR967_04170 [Proteobacteria bacterium]|nr:MAG: hypothetical protein CR967_04170 [Pseudomonadota bacterium]